MRHQLLHLIPFVAATRTAFVIVSLVTSATAGAEVKPTSPDAFLGKWDGSWQDVGGAAGRIDELTIAPPNGEIVEIFVKLTNAVVPGFRADAKFVNGELVVDQPTLSMVFRLADPDHLEATYHNLRNNARGSYSLKRTSGPAVGKAAAPDFATRLVDGSPWEGKFGDRPSGTMTVSFTMSSGLLTGEVISVAGSPTAFPGPVTALQAKGDTVTFRTPNNVSVELRLKGDLLEGTWFGRSSGWMSLSPRKSQ